MRAKPGPPRPDQAQARSGGREAEASGAAAPGAAPAPARGGAATRCAAAGPGLHLAALGRRHAQVAADVLRRAGVRRLVLRRSRSPGPAAGRMSARRFKLVAPVPPEHELQIAVGDALHYLLPPDAVFTSWDLANSKSAAEGARKKRR